MSRWHSPPLPQDEDLRTFAKGDRVRAHWSFSHGCPSHDRSWGPTITKGSKGTVTADPAVRDDPPFEPKRMVPVRWDTGVIGEVVDSLLEIKK